MTGPLIRIFLRYGVGALVMWGLVTAAMGDKIANDPDVAAAIEIGLGLAIAAATEAYYWAAKRWGYAT